jgi:hypothetical protein
MFIGAGTSLGLITSLRAPDYKFCLWRENSPDVSYNLLNIHASLLTDAARDFQSALMCDRSAVHLEIFTNLQCSVNKSHI